VILDDTPMALRDVDDLPAAEFLRRIESPLTDEEIEDTRQLVEWFLRRYPTPLARLRYVRRKYAEWTRHASVRHRP